MKPLPEIKWSENEPADLHIHSHYSDGQHTPREIAEIASRKGIRVISLTDHARIDGIPEITFETAKLGIYVIPGIELNGLIGDFLGYFIDYDNPRFLSFLDDVNRLREIRVKKISRLLKETGIEIEWGELAAFSRPAVPSRTHLARFLIKKGFFRDVDEVFGKLLGQGKPAYLPSDGPPDEECVSMIREARGIPVLAHPHYIRDIGEKSLSKYCAKLASWGVVGYENFLDKDACPHVLAKWDRFCLKKGALRFDGSNFHGRETTDVSLGDRVVGCDLIKKTVDLLTPDCVHKSLFKRMMWRSANLSDEEFRESLFPETVVIEENEYTRLLDFQPPDLPVPDGFMGTPFVLCGPGAVGRNGEVAEVLRKSGFEIVSTETSEGYPELAWTIYKMYRLSKREKMREMLRFDLDRKLYGNDASKFGIIFFRNDTDIDLRRLKKRIRTQMGRIRFFRAVCKDMSETYLTTYVHIPDNKDLDRECRVLHRFGIRCSRQQNNTEQEQQ